MHSTVTVVNNTVSQIWKMLKKVNIKTSQQKKEIFWNFSWW